MNIRKQLLILMMACFLLSCSSDKNAAITAEKSNIAVKGAGSTSAVSEQKYSIEISPAEPTRNSTLAMSFQGFKASDASIEWRVNGVPAPVQEPLYKFSAAGTKRGDRIQARAVYQGQEIMSNTVEIKNTPPEISHVKIVPDAAKPGQAVRVEADGTDVDGDSVSFTYEWKKNGEPAGNGEVIDAQINRGDRIAVKITPYDGTDYGKFMILERTVAGISPVISQEKKSSFDGKTLTCQINASDPDGDNLVYSLKSAPADMRINSDTGLITWEVPQRIRGSVPVTVSVRNRHGGESTHSFDISVR